MEPKPPSSPQISKEESPPINLRELSEKMQTVSFREKIGLQAFVKLVENLGEKLSTYDTILSDDASGRLISLVLRKVIDEARKRKDLGNVHTYFLATGRHKKIKILEAINNFLLKKKPEIQKALVVTEFMQSGGSMKQLVDILNNLGIDFDIAALGIANNPTNYSPEITNRLYYGNSGSLDGTAFAGRYYYTGVKVSKTFTEEISSPSSHPKKIPNIDSVEIKKARKDVERLAEELEKLI